MVYEIKFPKILKKILISGLLCCNFPYPLRHFTISAVSVFIRTHATYSINLYPYSIVNSINFHLRHSFVLNFVEIVQTFGTKNIKSSMALKINCAIFQKTKNRGNWKICWKCLKTTHIHNNKGVRMSTWAASEYWIQNVGEKLWKIIKLKAWTFLTA